MKDMKMLSVCTVSCGSSAPHPLQSVVVKPHDLPHAPHFRTTLCSWADRACRSGAGIPEGEIRSSLANSVPPQSASNSVSVPSNRGPLRSGSLGIRSAANAAGSAPARMAPSSVRPRRSASTLSGLPLTDASFACMPLISVVAPCWQLITLLTTRLFRPSTPPAFISLV